MFSVNPKANYDRGFDLTSLLGDLSECNNVQNSCHPVTTQLQHESKPNCSSAASFFQSFVPPPSPAQIIEQQPTVPRPVQHYVRNTATNHNVISHISPINWGASNTKISPQQVIQAFRGQVNYNHNKNGICKPIKKPKRKRTMFTTEQVIALENVFKDRPYISKDERLQLSNLLNINETSVKVWFQNRRLKRKIEAEYTSDEDQDKHDFHISRLNYIESKLSRLPCYNGFVSLDEEVLEELGKAINTALSGNVIVQMVYVPPTEVIQNPVIDVEKYECGDATSDSSITKESSSVADDMSPEELLEGLFQGIN